MMDRKEQIAELYREILKRNPDKEGLDNYFKSSLTIKGIKSILESSPEAKALERLEGNKISATKPTPNISNENLLIMGASPKNKEHLGTLQNAGVEAVLCLDEETDYDHSWSKTFLHVPIAPNRPISPNSLEKCVEFMYTNVVKKSRKTFIHSTNGISRAPLLISMFLFVEKRVPFLTALAGVMKQRPGVEPDRQLVNSDLLEAAINLRSRFGRVKSAPRLTGPKSPVDTSSTGVLLKVSEELVLGTYLNDSAVEILNKDNVKSVIDLNLKKSSYSSDSFNCRTVHIPVDGNTLRDLLPVIVKNSLKFISKSPIYLYCKDPSVLRFVFEAVVAGLSPDKQAVIDVPRVRKELSQ